MLRISKKPAALTAAAVLTAALGIPAVTATASPSTAAECVQAGLVWVHVEFDDTVTGACASEFKTGQEALLDTGLTTQTDAYVTEIAGRTAVEKEWWSVYSKAPAGGSYPTAWDFAQVGLNQLELNPSDVLAVVLQADWSAPETLPPGSDPVAGVVLAPEPTPTAAPSPTAQPSHTTVPSPTAEPSPTPLLPSAPNTSETPKRTPSPTPNPGLPATGV